MPAAPSQRTFAAYPHRHDGFDFKVAWKTTQVPQGVALEGVMQNVRYSQVADLQVTVSLLDARKKVLAEATTFPIPPSFNLDEYRDFGLMLKNVTLSPGDLLHFRLLYQAVDDETSGLRWLTNFTVDPFTGAAIIPPEERNTGL